MGICWFTPIMSLRNYEARPSMFTHHQTSLLIIRYHEPFWSNHYRPSRTMINQNKHHPCPWSLIIVVTTRSGGSNTPQSPPGIGGCRHLGQDIQLFLAGKSLKYCAVALQYSGIVLVMGGYPTTTLIRKPRIFGAAFYGHNQTSCLVSRATRNQGIPRCAKLPGGLARWTCQQQSRLIHIECSPIVYKTTLKYVSI